MEDREIVSLFLDRDETALKSTSEKYGKRLRSLSFGIVQDTWTAEECENDTYLQAWNSIPPNKPWDYLYAFLARITRHISLNRCRERDSLKRSAHICELSNEMQECIPSSSDGEYLIEDIVLKDLLNSFLAELPKEQRQIFMRRYWFMDSVSEISKRFSVSESKVKTTLFRTRNLLRDYLSKEDYTL